jgi:AMIN domain
MLFRNYLLHACVFLLLMASSAAENGSSLFVRGLALTGNNPLQLRIQTTGLVTPQLQMVSGPERLVIDLPNARPGAGVRDLMLNRAEVKGVRVGVFSTKPLVTRVVVDLNAPHWYRIASEASGLTITLGSDAENAGNGQPTIGWVAAKLPVRVAGNHAPPSVKTLHPEGNRPIDVNGVRVQFADGLMTIHANNATLSEILFQIHNTTGAEIAIPSGAEQDRVAADFGPGTPSQVLAQLLNGSGLNFVVVGSEDDPNGLRSVILSRTAGGVDPPSAIADAPLPPDNNNEPTNAAAPPPPENPAVPPQARPANPPN